MNEKENAEYVQKAGGHYSKVLNYLEAMRFHYGKDVLFICGYEAGCLGFTLYRDLTAHNVQCVILAPTTIAVPAGKKRLKTDKRDTELIARCHAHHNYSEVHVPAEKDEQIKEYIRMVFQILLQTQRTIEIQKRGLFHYPQQKQAHPARHKHAVKGADSLAWQKPARSLVFFSYNQASRSIWF